MNKSLASSVGRAWYTSSQGRGFVSHLELVPQKIVEFFNSYWKEVYNFLPTSTLKNVWGFTFSIFLQISNKLPPQLRFIKVRKHSFLHEHFPENEEKSVLGLNNPILEKPQGFLGSLWANIANILPTSFLKNVWAFTFSIFLKISNKLPPQLRFIKNPILEKPQGFLGSLWANIANILPTSFLKFLNEVTSIPGRCMWNDDVRNGVCRTVILLLCLALILRILGPIIKVYMIPTIVKKKRRRSSQQLISNIQMSKSTPSGQQALTWNDLEGRYQHRMVSVSQAEIPGNMIGCSVTCRSVLTEMICVLRGSRLTVKEIMTDTLVKQFTWTPSKLTRLKVHIIEHVHTPCLADPVLNLIIHRVLLATPQQPWGPRAEPHHRVLLATPQQPWGPRAEPHHHRVLLATPQQAWGPRAEPHHHRVLLATPQQLWGPRAEPHHRVLLATPQPPCGPRAEHQHHRVLLATPQRPCPEHHHHQVLRAPPQRPWGPRGEHQHHRVLLATPQRPCGAQVTPQQPWGPRVTPDHRVLLATPQRPWGPRVTHHRVLLATPQRPCGAQVTPQQPWGPRMNMSHTFLP
uniref:uncharacterized protein n=1 Tax=Myxine glutinosa TaxID=7769 RepID=UPI00358FEDD2